MKEFNEYRQYLIRLKLEAEKKFRQEEAGKAGCLWTSLSSAVLRGGDQYSRGEGCADGQGVVRKGLPISELS